MLKHGVELTLSRGLEQWLWFLGLDVCHPSGNLLVKYGLRKFDSANNKGSSRYQIEQNGDLIDLHSFFVGIYPNSSDGFIFIRARNRCFLYTAKHPPQPGDYGEEYMFTPETKELTNRFHTAAKLFLQWLEDYEAWIDKSYGFKYRDSCFKAYHLKWLCPSESRDWFSSFRHHPFKTKPVKPVEAFMKLL